MSTLAQVKAAMVNALKWIKTSNGYINNLPDANVYSRYNTTVISDTQDALYPKILVFPVGGDNEQRVSMQADRFIDFAIIIIVKVVSSSDDPCAMIEAYNEDLEKVFNEQNTLFGTVHNVGIESFAVDGGAIYPEGALIMRVKTHQIGSY